MDSTILGETAAELMDTLERDLPEGELVEVMVVVAVNSPDGGTHYRFRSSEEMAHRQFGLIDMARRTVEDEEDDYDEDEEA